MADNSGTFLELQTLLKQIEKTPSHSAKTAVIKEFLGDFSGDTFLLFRLMLCRHDKRAYHIREKGFVTALSQVFGCSDKAMLTDLEQGDMGETMRKFFIKSGMAKKKSTYTLKEVDNWLEDLCTQSKEEQQYRHFDKFIKRATADDLYYLTRIVDHDLKVFIGPAYALAALHPDAYKQWKVTNDLKSVVQKAKTLHKEAHKGGKPGLVRSMSLTIDLMTPVKPMLAKASKSLEDTWGRCPNGMLAEIKYDGERVQIHKNGNEFKTFSRSLKAVTPHKVAGVKDFIPKAFKNADEIILDAEILLQDSNTKKPLPFGTLGVHKKEIPGHIVLTEVYKPKTIPELQKLFTKTVQENLEGLVVKDFNGIYEPNMRHWIKIKKEHFSGMGDSADLVVLGAYFGSGSKGGKMSAFLMGTWDSAIQKWKSVVKCGSGFSEKELDALQIQFKDNVIKIEKDPLRCPSWLLCKNGHVPDFVVKNPKKSPVWEIGGAEFVPSTSFAAGISLRFPRLLKVRDDKDWKTATNLKELEDLFALGGINRTATGPAKFDKNAQDSDEDEMEIEPVKAKKTLGKQKKLLEDDESDDMDNTPKKPNNSFVDLPPVSDLKVKHLNGKATSLQSNDPVKVILVCSTCGHWPQKGVFQQISDRWEAPANVFKKKVGDSSLGDVISVPVGDGNTFVFILLAQKNGHGVPPICPTSLKTALQKARSKSLKIQATSVHISSMNPATPGLDWESFEQQLEQLFGTQNIQPYVYGKGGNEKKKQCPPDDEEDIILPPPKKQKQSHDNPSPAQDAPLFTSMVIKSLSSVSDSFQPKPQVKPTLFAGCSFLLHGHIDDSVQEMILSGGGKKHFEDDDVALQDVTHLLSNSSWVKGLYDDVLAENKSVKILRPDWVTLCVKNSKLEWTGPFMIKRGTKPVK